MRLWIRISMWVWVKAWYISFYIRTRILVIIIKKMILVFAFACARIFSIIFGIGSITLLTILSQTVIKIVFQKISLPSSTWEISFLWPTLHSIFHPTAHMIIHISSHIISHPIFQPIFHHITSHIFIHPIFHLIPHTIFHMKLKSQLRILWLRLIFLMAFPPLNQNFQFPNFPILFPNLNFL